MKKFFFFFVLLIFVVASAKEGKPVLKSRVLFKKNPSQSEIEGWEKNFFKDYDTEFANNSEQSDASEATDDDVMKLKKIVRKARKSVKIIKAPSVIVTESEQVVAEPEKKPEIVEKNSNIKNGEVAQQPKKTDKIYDMSILEPAKVDVREKSESNDSDNEVDRNGQIRKMKELLKKRKGKGRIEDRRIY